MQTLTFDVNGMSCGGCTSSVQHALSKLDGISHVEVTLPGTAIVHADPTRIVHVQIESAITKLGYAAKFRSVASDEKVMS